MIRLKLAIRNLWRNTRRTLLCIAMITAGFTAIVMFRGFGQNLVDKLQYLAIRVQYGHFQVATSATWSGAPVEDPVDRLLSSPDEIEKIIRSKMNVERIAPRLSFFGLLGDEVRSVAAQAIGIDPKLEKEVMDSLIYLEGQPLGSDQADGILVGSGLAAQLQAKVGKPLTLLTNTVDGTVNAIDVQVAAVITTGMREFDRFTFFFPVKTAQKVMDTDRVEKLTVYLPEPHNIIKSMNLVKSILPEGAEARSYRDLADIYMQTETYFETQNMILAIIIFALVMLSTLNIVSNSVVERTGEIGTLRALGERRRDIVILFLLEGVLLALIGGILGSIISVIMCKAVSAMGFPVTIPGTMKPIPLEFAIVGSAFLQAMILTMVTAAVGSAWPALRASRMAVTDALRRNLE